MAARGAEFAHVRLTAQLHPLTSAGERCLHYRLEAKAAGEAWSTRSTVVHGTERVGPGGRPSRDDMLAWMTECLLGIRWED